jgi:hypothetical protein
MSELQRIVDDNQDNNNTDHVESSERENDMDADDVLVDNNDSDNNDDDNHDYIDNDDDEPEAEGDAEILDNKPTTKLLVSEEIASSMKFYTLCVALEAVWKASTGGGSSTTDRSNNKKNKKWSDIQKLWRILPPKFLQHLYDSSNPLTTAAATNSSSASNSNGPTQTDQSNTTTTTDTGIRKAESIFPILRLLLPEKDGSRQFHMAESTISIMYGNALGLSQQSMKYKMLLYYTDPNYVTMKEYGLGDLSIVVQTVVASTKINLPNSGSTYTVGHINDALDILASLPAKARQYKSNHDWNQTGNNNRETNSKKQKMNNKISLKDLRIQWLRQLNDGTFKSSNTTRTTDTINSINNGLSPLEHKWLVRILLKKMQFGLVRCYSFFFCWYSNRMHFCVPTFL